MPITKLSIVLYVGYPSFPAGYAQFKRQYYICKALLNAHLNPIVLNRFGVHPRTAKVHSKGKYHGITYYYCSGSAYTAPSYFLKKISAIRGLFGETYLIIRYCLSNRVACIFVSTNYFHNLLFYKILSILLGVPIINDVVERRSACNAFNYYDRISDILYDKLVVKCSTALIFISHRLRDEIGCNTKKFSLVVPALYHFQSTTITRRVHQSSNIVKQLGSKPYFLICAGIGYFDLLKFTIESFEMLKNSSIMLIIITTKGGKFTQLESIAQNSCADVRIIVDLSEEDLHTYYSSSRALLAPLRQSVQDLSRFPQKIAEYASTGKPIVTSRHPDVLKCLGPYGAFYCDSCSITEYSNVMNKILANPQKAINVGRLGFLNGKRNLNYLSYSAPLYSLIASLSK